VQANVRSRASVAAALDGAQAAVNLVGVLYEAGGQTFEALHAKAPGLIARLAAERGVEQFVQMSALGADAKSRSAYARSKAAGETAAREAIPGAVALRPSVVFGPEDAFFNRFASLASMAPALPLVGGGATRFQPVYVGDVAGAVAEALRAPALAGGTYELGGPSIYTFRELMEFVLRETGRRKPLVPLPFGVAGMIGAMGDLQARIGMPPQLTRDQVALLRTDNVVSGRHPGLEAFGISPTAAEAVVPSYLWRYRKGGQFADITPQGFLSHRQHG
jgi:NADH dehydrogenase